MELAGISTALERGCRLYAYRSDEGLRIIRLERTGHLKGYGEHPHIEDALTHANEDYLAGGRRYEDVYGKIHPQYLAGSHEISSDLDAWIKDGYSLVVVKQNDEIVVELQGINRFLFTFVKIGHGATFFEAIENAFDAEETIKC